MPTKNLKEIIKGILQGKRVPLTKALSLAEDSAEHCAELIDTLHRHSGNAHVIGVTGAPGTGKSTTIDKLISKYRADDKAVGVLAVDPTSPFSGGAFLGDRFRMHDHILDDGVFIRSMASRGQLGGISAGTYDSVTVMDAAGFDVVIVETVGTGQADVDVAKVADTTVLVMTPEYGDEIHLVKAGVIEVADIFAINKTYLSGCPRLESSLTEVLKHSSKNPKPQVVMADARDDACVGALRDAIDGHYSHLVDSGALGAARKERARLHLLDAIDEEVRGRLRKGRLTDKKLHKYLDSIYSKKESVYSVRKKVLRKRWFFGLF